MTAIEWLEEQMFNLQIELKKERMPLTKYESIRLELLEQAKEMEKEALAIIRKFVNQFDEEGEVSWNTRDEAHNFLNNL